jgi:serine carboxypeptidase-like clade 2
MLRECNVATEAAGKDLQRINIYNIYAPLCSSPNITAKPKKASVS